MPGGLLCSGLDSGHRPELKQRDRAASSPLAEVFATPVTMQLPRRCPECGRDLTDPESECPSCRPTQADSPNDPDATQPEPLGALPVLTTTFEGELRPGLRLAAGRFILSRKLGEGGMGAVWQAIDLQLSEDGAPVQVALKFIGGGLAQDHEAIRLLRKEVRASLQLTHPNIVRVHSWHEHPGEPVFYSMEYVDGRDLKQHVAGRLHGRLTVADLAWILEPLLGALHYAHTTAGIVHRDLKPANVMLQAGGGVKLADFGLARPEVSDESGATTRGGTPGYSSPQQMRGEAPQVSDDIFSLGATLYHVLTGELPYRLAQVRGREPMTPPRDPRTVIRGKKGARRRDIPAEAALTLLRCLEEDPARRPPDIATFRQWWKSGPDQAEQEVAARRLLVPWLRAAGRLGVTAVLLAVLVGALAGMTWDAGLGNLVEKWAPWAARHGDAALNWLEDRFTKRPPPPLLGPEDILQPALLVQKLSGPILTNRPVDRMRRLFRRDWQDRLAGLDRAGPPETNWVAGLVSELNRIILEDSLWDAEAFPGELPPALRKLAAKAPRRHEKVLLNRQLVDRALGDVLKALVSADGPASIPPQTLELLVRGIPAGETVLSVQVFRESLGDSRWANPAWTTNVSLSPLPRAQAPVRVEAPRLDPGIYHILAWLSNGRRNIGWIRTNATVTVTNGDPASTKLAVALSFFPAKLRVFSELPASLQVVDRWTNAISQTSKDGHQPFTITRPKSWRMNLEGGVDGELAVPPGEYRVRLAPEARLDFTGPEDGWDFVVCRPGQVTEVDVAPVARLEARMRKPWKASKGWINALFLPVEGDRPFLGAQTETTVGIFRAFTAQTGFQPGRMLSISRTGSVDLGRTWSNAFPAEYCSDDLPVVGVSWHDATNFCHWLTQVDRQAGLIRPGWRYKLPSRQQWMAMVGPHQYPWRGRFPPLNHQGNYARMELIQRPTRGGSLPKEGADTLGRRQKLWELAKPVDFWPEAWRSLLESEQALAVREDAHPFAGPVRGPGDDDPVLLHLGGNVAEWCDTWYKAPADARGNPHLHPRLCDDRGGNHYRVVCGGSWFDHLDPELLRTDAFWVETPDTRNDRIGFRVILVDGEEP